MTEPTKTTFDGQCACGQVRYRLNGAPLFVHCCHCLWCQRESGSGFALNTMYEADHVTLLQGAPEKIDTPTKSGKGQIYVRCACCKVALWSHYGGAGNALAFVRIGTLENPGHMQPDVHIFTRSKQPWVQLPETVPAFDAFYNRGDLWPEGALARRQAAIDRKAVTGVESIK